MELFGFICQGNSYPLCSAVYYKWNVGTDSTGAHLSPPLGDWAECITPVSMASRTLAYCVMSHHPFKRLNYTYSFLFFIFLFLSAIHFSLSLSLESFFFASLSLSSSLYLCVSPTLRSLSLSSLPYLPSLTPFPSHNKAPHISSVFLVCVSFTRSGLDSTHQGLSPTVS